MKYEYDIGKSYFMLGIEIGRYQKTIQANNFKDKIPKMIKTIT